MDKHAKSAERKAELDRAFERTRARERREWTAGGAFFDEAWLKETVRQAVEEALRGKGESRR